MKYIDPYFKAWWILAIIGLLILLVLQLAGVPVD